MQNLPEQDLISDAEVVKPQLSYPKRVEIWMGRLAMVSFTTTVAALVLNVGY